MSGPAAGTPSQVITRAMFGIRGNRANIALTGWFVSVCYLALSWAAASLSAFSLVDKAGIALTTGVKVVVIVVLAAATLAISVYGHATIVKLYLPFTLALTAVFVVLAGYVLGHVDWSYAPRHQLHGTELWAVMIGGITLVASAPLSYSNSADFARYLPRTTSPWAISRLDHPRRVRAQRPVHLARRPRGYLARHVRPADRPRDHPAELVQAGVPRPSSSARSATTP